MHDIPLQQSLAEIKDRHVAVVYQYLPPRSPKEVWYHTWGLGVMAFYGYGFEALRIKVQYIDVESFVRSERVSPQKLDYVLTLVCGNLHISNWSLIPALAFWRGAIPLPASADALIASERKDISSLFARHVGMTCPDEYAREDLSELENEVVVAKPRDYGSSKGLLIASPAEVAKVSDDYSTPYIFQQFVPGIDVTVAAIYDPIHRKYRFGQAIAYIPELGDFHWTFDDQAKTRHRSGGQLGEVKKLFFDLPEPVAAKAVQLIAKLGGSSLARIDFRVTVGDEELLHTAGSEVYSFLEINLCPTISEKSNFIASLRGAIESRSYPLTSRHQEFFATFPSEIALNAYIVFCMVSYGDLTSKCNVLLEKASFDE